MIFLLLYPISNFFSYQHFSPSNCTFISKLFSIPIPQNLQEALSDPKWREAMHKQMRAVNKNNTWEFIELPNEKKTIWSKWMFTVKHKANGSMERYKVRLVAKGFTQTYGINYEEMFASVSKMNSIQVLFLAANLDWSFHQFDVKNAYIHWDLEEEVHIEVRLVLNFPSPMVKCKS